MEEGEGQSKEAGLVTHTSTVVRPGISLGTLYMAGRGVGGMEIEVTEVGGMALPPLGESNSHHPDQEVGMASVADPSSPTVTGMLPTMTISNYRSLSQPVSYLTIKFYNLSVNIKFEN